MTREELVELARSYVGARVDDEDGRLLDLIAPPELEPANMRHDMARMSTCALFARGVLRAVGVEHHTLADPYRVGHAMGDLVLIGRDLDALRAAPQAPGDVVVVGTGGHEHVYVVLELERLDDYRTRIVSADGGQLVAGVQAVLEIERWIGGSTDHRVTPPQTSRPVAYVLDADALFSA